MKQARINRLLGVSGNCFDVAIDHGMFNEKTFLPGIEDMRKAIHVIAEAKPDAIQLPPARPRSCRPFPGKDRPALVMRTDIANVYYAIPARASLLRSHRPRGRTGCRARRSPASSSIS